MLTLFYNHIVKLNFMWYNKTCLYFHKNLRLKERAKLFKQDSKDLLENVI